MEHTIAYQNMKCPGCNSPKVGHLCHVDLYVDKANQVTLQMRCNVCKASWVNVYELYGMDKVQLPKQTEEQIKDERDALIVANKQLRECLREIDKYEHPGNKDPLTIATLTIKTIKGFARNRLIFKDEDQSRSEQDQAQGSAKDGE